jgi:hypothetical protein
MCMHGTLTIKPLYVINRHHIRIECGWMDLTVHAVHLNKLHNQLNLFLQIQVVISNLKSNF